MTVTHTKKNYIVGIDPATKTGIVVMEILGGKLSVVTMIDFDILKDAKLKSQVQDSTKFYKHALARIEGTVKSILGIIDGNTVIVGIENNIFLGKNNGYHAGVQHAIIAFFKAFLCVGNVTVIDVSPIQIKKVIGGNGKATKNELRVAIKNHLDWFIDADKVQNISFKNFDLSDAFCIALYTFFIYFNKNT